MRRERDSDACIVKFARSLNFTGLEMKGSCKASAWRFTYCKTFCIFITMIPWSAQDSSLMSIFCLYSYSSLLLLGQCCNTMGQVMCRKAKEKEKASFFILAQSNQPSLGFWSWVGQKIRKFAGKQDALSSLPVSSRSKDKDKQMPLARAEAAGQNIFQRTWKWTILALLHDHNHRTTEQREHYLRLRENVLRWNGSNQRKLSWIEYLAVSVLMNRFGWKTR